MRSALIFWLCCCTWSESTSCWPQACNTFLLEGDDVLGRFQFNTSKNKELVRHMNTQMRKLYYQYYVFKHGNRV